ncbi:MAG: hypothetical protein ABF296_10160 [Oceanococcaceae bacterium]
MNGSRQRHRTATRLLTAGGLGLIVVMALDLPGLVIPLLICLTVWGLQCWRSERKRKPRPLPFAMEPGLVKSRMVQSAIASKRKPLRDPADSLCYQLRQTPEGRLRLLRAANREVAARESEGPCDQVGHTGNGGRADQEIFGSGLLW